MKKVIFLRKIPVTMKTFAPTFFNSFSLNLTSIKERLKNHKKKTKHIHDSAANLLHIIKGVSIGANADIAKMILFIVERWMQCLLLWLKSWDAMHTSHSWVVERNKDAG